ncbi:serine hydrolase [Maridesulfovibrio salexigens]|uniref:Beta-lactamase n=1 Tax=Maridesulfovibrio salexigens (strain ATCC 14822 / DSM 2638 / NCIMB 8403 / VKM B-1763) TaxID=526222 RepID=C6C1F0_MARSD|nr:serine hydrolase [Maridesulfovibrio salexigens]ACS81125.1 Beta-lactamase [Maridesulfovibrio salexigens DSM 2638]
MSFCRVVVFIFLWVCMFCSTVVAGPVVLDKRLAGPFKDCAYKGCFVLLDAERSIITASDLQLADQPLMPASTFKIVHSLIALKTGVHESIDSVLKWDGKDRGYKPWNQDLSLAQAVKHSAIWYFEETAGRIGRDRIHEELLRLDYTNADTEGPTIAFWLDGNLRVTPLEQVEFLEKLYNGILPFPQEDQKAIRDILLLERNDKYTLWGKTGWAQRVNPQIGWLVGAVKVKEGRMFYYATYLESPEPGASFSKSRFDVTKKCLKLSGVI